MKPVCIISERNGSRKDMEQGNVTEREEGWRRGGHFLRVEGSRDFAVSRNLEVKKKPALCIARECAFQAEAWSREGVTVFVVQKGGHGGWSVGCDMRRG